MCFIYKIYRFLAETKRYLQLFEYVSTRKEPTKQGMV